MKITSYYDYHKELTISMHCLKVDPVTELLKKWLPEDLAVWLNR